jgi:Family of unknown function (DUF5320)
MPARDGTGPLGMGPMTGKRMGCCARSTNIPAVPSGGWARGRGGRTPGGHFRAIEGPPMSQFEGRRWEGPSPGKGVWVDSLDDLRWYAGNLEEALESVRARILELEKKEKQGEDS